MNNKVRIALDAMGGDHGLSVTVPAAFAALDEFPEISLVMVGDQELLGKEIQAAGLAPTDRLQIHHASEVVAMDELPSRALRNKKDSSMRVAINLVKAGEVEACVSAGNTGALMAMARYVLKMLDGIDRPAIISALPTMRGHTHMLDLGANVDSLPEHLVQFAVMGSILATAVDGNPNPSVGLLNIGEEEIKGNEGVKATHLLLEKSGLNYYGFVEGSDIFKGTVDVVVCDGFVGNVALKTTEGVARMISHFMKMEFTRNPLTKLAGLIALPVLKAFRDKIDPRHYNGASLLGLQGIVIKSHGDADVLAFKNAIKIARLEVENSVIEKTRHLVGPLMRGI